MLVRAARRKVRQQDASVAFNQLQLPWLCPAYITWRNSSSYAPHLEVRKQKLAQQPVRTNTRSLATAAEGSFFTSHFEPIPFTQKLPTPSDRQNDRPPSFLSRLKSWSPTQPIVIHNSVAVPPPRLKHWQGMGGDPAELFQNLHACLRVGRMDRAVALVRRMREIYHTDAPELLEAHNQYLRGMVDMLQQKGSDATLRNIQQWFEVEMRGRGMRVNATTLVLMIRASMGALRGSKRERALRRYLHLAEEAGPGVYESVMSSGEYSTADWEMLIRLRPDMFAAPSSEDVTSASEDTSPSVNPSVPGTDVPEVRPVDQKGLGLQTLKKSLSIFSNKDDLPYPNDMAGTKEEKDKAWAYMRQDRLEEDVVDAATDRWRQENEQMQKMGINSALQTRPLEALMWQWHSTLLPLIKKELKDIRHALDKEAKDDGDDRLIFGPFLETFTAEKLAALSIITILNSFTADIVAGGSKLTMMTLKLGASLEAESNAEALRKRAITKLRGRRAARERTQMLIKLYRGAAQFTTAEAPKTEQEQTMKQFHEMTGQEWPTAVKAKAGAMLLAKVIECAKIPVKSDNVQAGDKARVLQPAFTHTYAFRSGKKVGIIKAHDALIEKLMREPVRGAIGARLPMVVEPRPWTGFKEGGFLRYPVPAVRSKGSDETQRMYALAAAERGDMEQVFAGLDVLGKTPWRINRDVFNVMLEAWNTGEAIGKIAPENPDINYPPEPGPSATSIERTAWTKQVRDLDNLKAGYHSQRCFQNFQLEVARALRDEVFYYPHNLDFRGRAYPIPPYLNHMGADNCRGLLMFGKGKELGTVGLRWLKVHLANVYGFDKASLKEREEFTEEHLEDVYDSATNPLTGRRWWSEAEDPWQCLAACFELKNALDSPIHSQFVSHLAVHQDGTCNGLQHYAALGGDRFGASQVNLEPGDRPADIYTAVAELVKADVKADLADGHAMAKMLDGKITRKVVKQTVMTNVYGVTFAGARAQVQKQLENIMPDYVDSPGLSLVQLSSYIAKKIFKALSTMFSGAHDIQYWLGECADRISTVLTPEQLERFKAKREGLPELQDPKFRKLKRKNQPEADKLDQSAFKSSVIWTTPLKMPVVQPYRQAKAREVYTTLQRISIREPHPYDPVSKRKQLQGFPPNFIHSLDATHMLLSALKCDEVGLTFASVHDSFWTHAADVPAMNHVLRDAFIRMHSENIIGRLAAEFSARYKGCIYLAKVYAHSPLGRQILAFRREKRHQVFETSGKRMTNGMLEELLAEKERQRLLQSEDPEGRKKGQEMVTPASIYEAAEDPSAFQVPEEAETIIHGPSRKDTDAFSKDVVMEASDSLADENAELLEPVMDEADAASSHPEAAEIADAVEEAHDEHPVQAEVPKAPRTKAHHKLQLWLPLTFPPVPKKGDFDVSRLKDSQYFFS